MGMHITDPEYRAVAALYAELKLSVRSCERILRDYEITIHDKGIMDRAKGQLNAFLLSYRIKNFL